MNREEFEKLKDKRLRRYELFKAFVTLVCICCGMVIVVYFILVYKMPPPPRVEDIRVEASPVPVKKIVAEAVELPAAAEPKRVYRIRGDKQSKSYYTEVCSAYNDVPDKNTVWFESIEEAESKGYRLTKNC